MVWESNIQYTRMLQDNRVSMAAVQFANRSVARKDT